MIMDDVMQCDELSSLAAALESKQMGSEKKICISRAVAV